MAKKKNQIIIDLGEIKLTNEQRMKLNNTLHEAVFKNVKSIEKNMKLKGPKPVGTFSKSMTNTVSLKVSFRDVNPGLSSLTATHDNTEHTINQSNTMTFNNVKTADTIDIDGDSAGSTTITVIGANSKPMQMSFAPGQHISGSFFIL